jgi:DNA primase
MILVEGYMDVVGLSEKGVNNAVATMGTALTEEHCQMIRGYVPRVVTVFDPDAGGKEAWHRSVHLLLSSGLLAKDLTLPDEKDPDEFVQEAGAETFYQMCQAAPRQITKLLKEIASEGQLTEEATGIWLERLSPVLYATRRAPDRALIWDNISLVLKVSHEALKEMSETYSGRKAATAPLVNPKPSNQAPKAPVAKPLSNSDKLDFEFFKSCLDSPKTFLDMKPSEWAPLLQNERARHWLEKLAAVQTAQSWVEVLSQLVQTETDLNLQGIASENLMSEQKEAQNNMQSEGQPKAKKAEILLELTERLKKRQRERSIKALTTQIKLSEKMGDEKEGLRLLSELKSLRTTPS